MCVPVARAPELVRRALDAECAARRRARCLRGAVINAALLLALTADLSSACPGRVGALHWVEAAVAGVAGANLLRLALALCRRAPPPPALRPRQRRLLALRSPSLDSSFGMSEPSVAESLESASASSLSDELSLSLSPAREWRGGGAGAGAGAPPSPPSPSELDASPPPRDCFIADRRSLAHYLQQYEERSRSGAVAGSAAVGAVGGAAAAYHTACVEEGGAGEDAGAGLAAAALRLSLDPTRLAQFHLNLRLWLHVTIVERLAAASAEAEAALARVGLAGALAQLPAERLQALAAGPLAPPVLAPLLPFLEPFPRRAYVLRRVRELAAGGALADYRGAAGPAHRQPGDPSDAELLLHLFAAYLDAQLPSAAPALRPFSARYVAAAPAPPPAGPAIYLARARPAHYVLALGGDTLEVARGRDNLLHTLLVFLAAAARARPPALGRLHLGPAGLNMLWIIGRH